MPLWVLLALIAPFRLAAVSVIDKIILDRYVRTPLLYPFYTGVVEAILGVSVITIILLARLEDVNLSVIGGSMAMGSLRGIALVALVGALRHEQVSRVVALWFLNPIIVAGLAIIFLSESISTLAIVAIAMASLGAGVVSWTGGGSSRGFMRPSAIVMALGAALAWAVANILAKYFVDGDSFWQFFFGSRIGFGGTLLLLVFSRKVRREAPHGWRSRPLLWMYLLAEITITVSLILYYSAINMGPVSLVSALGALQPLLVLVYSIALALLFPAAFSGWITRGKSKLVPQLVGTAVLAIGIGIVSVQ
jgi:drug/metabolite transporter (DMT)-like permease